MIRTAQSAANRGRCLSHDLNEPVVTKTFAFAPVGFALREDTAHATLLLTGIQINQIIDQEHGALMRNQGIGSH